MGIYRKLGIKELINAEGTITSLGGCVMQPAVVAAMAEAAQSFVDLNQLLAKAGRHVAALLGVEAVYITAGAAAGLTLSTAACITGADPAKIRQLPDLRRIEKNEVLIQKSHRNGYDHAVRQAGVKVVEFGLIKETYPWEMRAAISEKTAAIVHFLEFAGKFAWLVTEHPIDIPEPPYFIFTRYGFVNQVAGQLGPNPNPVAVPSSGCRWGLGLQRFGLEDLGPLEPAGIEPATWRSFGGP